MIVPWIQAIATGIALISAPATLSANTGFPRWYNALLSLHMPQWLIKILENPWLIAAAAAALFLTKVILFSYLSAQLIKERRKSRRLNEQCNALNITNLELRRDNEHHKAVVAHLTETLINLSTIKAPFYTPLHTKIANDTREELNTPPSLPL